MRDALQLHIILAARAIIQKQNGRVAAREEMLQCEQLATVAHRVGSEEAKFRKRIDDEPVRLHLLNELGQFLDCFRQLDLAWVKY